MRKYANTAGDQTDVAGPLNLSPECLTALERDDSKVEASNEKLGKEFAMLVLLLEMKFMSEQTKAKLEKDPNYGPSKLASTADPSAFMTACNKAGGAVSNAGIAAGLQAYVTMKMGATESAAEFYKSSEVLRQAVVTTFSDDGGVTFNAAKMTNVLRVQGLHKDYSQLALSMTGTESATTLTPSQLFEKIEHYESEIVNPTRARRHSTSEPSRALALRSAKTETTTADSKAGEKLCKADGCTTRFVPRIPAHSYCKEHAKLGRTARPSTAAALTSAVLAQSKSGTSTVMTISRKRTLMWGVLHLERPPLTADAGRTWTRMRLLIKT
jgi:hypothetical protein